MPIVIKQQILADYVAAEQKLKDYKASALAQLKDLTGKSEAEVRGMADKIAQDLTRGFDLKQASRQFGQALGAVNQLVNLAPVNKQLKETADSTLQGARAGLELGKAFGPIGALAGTALGGIAGYAAAGAKEAAELTEKVHGLEDSLRATAEASARFGEDVNVAETAKKFSELADEIKKARDADASLKVNLSEIREAGAAATASLASGYQDLQGEIGKTLGQLDDMGKKKPLSALRQDADQTKAHLEAVQATVAADAKSLGGLADIFKGFKLSALSEGISGGLIDLGKPLADAYTHLQRDKRDTAAATRDATEAERAYTEAVKAAASANEGLSKKLEEVAQKEHKANEDVDRAGLESKRKGWEAYKKTVDEVNTSLKALDDTVELMLTRDLGAFDLGKAITDATDPDRLAASLKDLGEKTGSAVLDSIVDGIKEAGAAKGFDVIELLGADAAGVSPEAYRKQQKDAKEFADTLKRGFKDLGAGIAADFGATAAAGVDVLFDRLQDGEKIIGSSGKAFKELEVKFLRSEGTKLIGKGISDELQGIGIDILSAGLDPQGEALNALGAVEIGAGLTMGGVGAALGKKFGIASSSKAGKNSDTAGAGASGGGASFSGAGADQGPKELAPVEISLGEAGAGFGGGDFVATSGRSFRRRRAATSLDTGSVADGAGGIDPSQVGTEDHKNDHAGGNTYYIFANWGGFQLNNAERQSTDPRGKAAFGRFVQDAIKTGQAGR